MAIPLIRIFVFDYGALVGLFKIEEDEKKVLVYTKLTDEELIKSMEVVARLIRRYKGQKTFKFQKFIGILGENYIVIGKLREDRIVASAFGFLMKILQKIDSLGSVPIDIVIKNVRDVFPLEYEFELITQEDIIEMTTKNVEKKRGLNNPGEKREVLAIEAERLT